MTSKTHVVAMALAWAAVCLCWTVGCSSPAGTGSDIEWRDDFDNLDPQRWTRVKGSAEVSHGWLVLNSTGPQGGAEVQSKRRFKFASLEVRAASANWSGDTSCGMEGWQGDVHRAIVITNGVLGIIDQSKPQPNEWYQEVPGWSDIKGDPHVFKLTWARKQIQLHVDGELAVTYEGSLIPEAPAAVRLNASNDHEDQLRVDYVSVK